MKRSYQTVASLLTAALLLSSGALAVEQNVADSQAGQTSTSVEEVAQQPNNLFTAGKISSISKLTSTEGYQVWIDNSLIVNLVAEGAAPIYDVRDGKVSTLAPDQLEEGMSVAVVYGSNTPMALSMPPQISQIKAMVVMPEAMTTVIDTFSPMENGSYINPTATLVLHVGEDTPIYDSYGQKMSAEQFVQNNAQERDAQSEYAVFYSVATFSLPPQTSPVLMLELDTAQEESAAFSLAQEEQQVADKQAVEMVPLRAAAEQAGYTVEWTGEQQVILKSASAVSYTLTIGQTQAGYNKSLIQLDAAPELRDGVTYVPSTFVEMLVQAEEK